MVLEMNNLQPEMEVQEPLGHDDTGLQPIQVRESLYVILNKKSRTLLDMFDGAQGARVHGHELSPKTFGDQVWIIKEEELKNTYTLRNLQYGTYLDLKGGSSENGSPVVGFTRQLDGQSRSNQEWRIEEREPNHYVIQCSRTNTYLEIHKGDPSNCTPATCSQAAGEMNHQLWSFDLISRTAPEIKSMFESWKENIGPQFFQSHENPVQYFVLPNQVRLDIWNETGLLRQPLHPQFFHDVNFVIRMKDAVTVWVKNRFQDDIRGFSVLFGMIYGETRKGPRAYNWYLSPDLFSLVFLDVQSGQEYGPAALDSFGFEPTFVLF